LQRVSNSADLPSTRPAAPPLLDPGWLFLIAGVALLGACILLPALEDAAEVKFRRDLVLSVETHRDLRLSRYEEFIGAVDSRNPQLIISLAESQLNQIPIDRGSLSTTSNPQDGTQSAAANASVFPSLEPAPLVLTKRAKQLSRLEGLTTNEGTRKWVLVVGAISVLIGLIGWSEPKR